MRPPLLCALGLADHPDTLVDLDNPQLAGVDDADLYEALIFSCDAGVFRKTFDQ